MHNVRSGDGLQESKHAGTENDVEAVIPRGYYILLLIAAKLSSGRGVSCLADIACSGVPGAVCLLRGMNRLKSNKCSTWPPTRNARFGSFLGKCVSRTDFDIFP